VIQFNFEIFADLIAAITFLVAACVGFLQGKRKRNSALILLGVASVGFGTSVGFQAISYMILVDNFDVALIMKEISVLLSVLGSVFVFTFVNYVWFERMRLAFLIPVVIIATLEIASIFLAEGLVPYYFFDGETLIATSIGKTGYLLIFEMIFANIGLNLVIIAYWTYSYLKAPATLKKTVRFLLIFIWLSVFTGIAITVIVRFSPNGSLNLFL